MTPFYKKALALFTRTQEAQIKKGMEKYPEPFNPHSWTPEELLNHALEETVDLTHYLVGLKELLDAKDKEIAELKERSKGAALVQKALAQKPIEEMRSKWKEKVYLADFNPHFDQDDQH
jgi:hypothetical protein